MVDVDTGKFVDMFDQVHVDKKWFFLTRQKENYILADGEEEPYRAVQHKNFITKVMFLCAQARPRFSPDGQLIWDGKLGIWPIGRIEPAKKTTKNREKGSPVWINETVNRNKYREVMITKVLPAICSKFPREYLLKGVVIQQDGAKLHIEEDDKEWLEADAKTNKTIKLYTQPG